MAIVIYDAVAIKSTATDGYQIYWNAKRTLPSQETVGDFIFKILWSESPSSGFVPIKYEGGGEVVIDGAIGPLYVLHQRPQHSHNVEYYYRIHAIKKINPAFTQTTPTFFANDASDGVIDSVIWSERMLYDLYIGEPVRLLKRRTDQERCPECWNAIAFRRTKTHCNSCLSTGFIDGYYAPIPIQVAFDANPKITEVGQTGEINITHVKARMSSYPLVSNRDMVVGVDDNDRYQIVKVDKTKLPNMSLDQNRLSGSAHTVSQILTLSEIPPTDDRYKYPIFGKYCVGTADIIIPAITGDISCQVGV